MAQSSFTIFVVSRRHDAASRQPIVVPKTVISDRAVIDLGDLPYGCCDKVLSPEFVNIETSGSVQKFYVIQ